MIVQIHEHRGGNMTPSFRLIAVLPAILLVCMSRPLAAADNDLARAYRVIASKRFVDLTHSFDPRSPVWSGFGQAKMIPASDPKTQRPYTIKEDGFRTTLYEFVGQYGTHVDPPAHFDENGYKDWDTDPERFKRAPFPAWSFETIRFLYEQRGVVATGHESLDTDTTDKMESETYLLQRGHYQIEVMANLDKVPPKGALIVVTWPKVRNGLGFPARAFAILP
jgi:kynurenine formamidase